MNIGNWQNVWFPGWGNLFDMALTVFWYTVAALPTLLIAVIGVYSLADKIMEGERQRLWELEHQRQTLENERMFKKRSN